MTTATANATAINWFEIPVRDMDRAQRFYETVLGTTLKREQMGPNALAVFAYDEPATGGALVQGAAYAPGATGPLVYLACGDALDPVLGRLEAAGGRVVTPKTVLPGDMGCFAHVSDSEGNRVGLHAMA